MISLLLFSFMAAAKESTLADFLQSAWEGSAHKNVEQFHGEAGAQKISAARAKYYPHVTLEALDTDGMPASNSDLHIGGLMGSPFRKGWAAGVVVEQSIYDFGRIGAALESAKAEDLVEQARLAEDKMHFLTSIGGLYLNCAKARSLERLNERLMNSATMLLNETRKYARTGQRSLVDRSLAQAEVLELELQKSELAQFVQSQKEQMELYSHEASCLPLSLVWRSEVSSALKVPEPTVLLAQANLQLSRAATEAASAAQRPALKLTGSAGEMQDVRLVAEKDYSVGVGVVFPIWNGGEDGHREQAARSATAAQSESLKLTALEVKRRLLAIRATFARDKEALSGLEKNIAQIRETMKLASRRYQSLEGPLIDVRDSFRQLRAMEARRIEVMSSLAANRMELALLNME